MAQGSKSGMLWRYQAQTVGRFGTLGEFIIRFPDEAECHDIAMSWEDVFGDRPCLDSAAEYAELSLEAAGNLRPQPAGQPPPNSVWDQRYGTYVDCEGIALNDVSRVGADTHTHSVTLTGAKELDVTYTSSRTRAAVRPPLAASAHASPSCLTCDCVVDGLFVQLHVFITVSLNSANKRASIPFTTGLMGGKGKRLAGNTNT